MGEKLVGKSILEKFLLGTSTIIIVILGCGLGIGIGHVKNTGKIPYTSQQSIALPTRILDKNNRLITSFFSRENRDLIEFSDMPRMLMMALITREDQTFLTHHGFSIRGTMRAMWNLLTNNYVSGGSTLSQQVAGTLYADRRQFSILRKLKELWWALQLERSWSKQELITEYLNKVYFGHGNYGAEAASQYFFGHGVKTLSSAEAVMLVIQLANPVRYSPFKNPNFARNRQEEILNQMILLGFIDETQAQKDFIEYWNNYDYTRAEISSAFLERNDIAPHFSEYIRGILINELGFTNDEINNGGYTIYTTLDIDIQKKAQEEFNQGLKKANRIYRANYDRLISQEENLYPIAALATLLFDDTEQLFDKTSLQKKEATDYFNTSIQPIISLSHLLFEPISNTLLGYVAFESKKQSNIVHQETTVEGALITLENDTGHIVSMIGGSTFDATNQFNRAVDAFVQPGSSFKPLYYSAAVEDNLISPSSIIWDSPVVFETEDGELYVPKNYKGEWKGKVSVRTALSNSMNVPSLKILNMVGFPRALEIAGGLLDIPKDNWEQYGLVPKYPIGLGILSVSPFSMAKAYATIANEGKKIPPIAIRFIEDREGKIIHEIEKQQKTEFSFAQKHIISPQTAYIISSILQSTVKRGTLAYAELQAGGFTQPTAGKTGTTQNWSDSWTVGFTPYYTTAIWFGFDRGGQSLGTNQTGALTTGPVWGKYMEAINKELPVKNFQKPQGIISLSINPDNNKQAVDTTLNAVQEIFISGTEPTEFDTPEETQFIKEIQKTRLEQSNWNLTIPLKQDLDEDIFFDYLSSIEETEETQDSESDTPSQLNMRLRIPSTRALRSTRPLKQNPNQDSSEENPEINIEKAQGNPLLF